MDWFLFYRLILLWRESLNLSKLISIVTNQILVRIQSVTIMQLIVLVAKYVSRSHRIVSTQLMHSVLQSLQLTTSFESFLYLMFHQGLVHIYKTHIFQNLGYLRCESLGYQAPGSCWWSNFFDTRDPSKIHSQADEYHWLRCDCTVLYWVPDCVWRLIDHISYSPTRSSVETDKSCKK